LRGDDGQPDRLRPGHEHLRLERGSHWRETAVTYELVDVPFGAHRDAAHLSRQPFAEVELPDTRPSPQCFCRAVGFLPAALIPGAR
jgi:hypothetical protein